MRGLPRQCVRSMLERPLLGTQERLHLGMDKPLDVGRICKSEVCCSFFLYLPNPTYRPSTIFLHNSAKVIMVHIGLTQHGVQNTVHGIDSCLGWDIATRTHAIGDIKSQVWTAASAGAIQETSFLTLTVVIATATKKGQANISPLLENAGKGVIEVMDLFSEHAFLLQV